MANFFTRVLDRVTPWNRGGEVQRRTEKKKRDDEERIRQQNAPTVRNTPQNPTPLNTPKPNQPVNVFEDLNKNLTLGQNRPGTIPVFNNPAMQQPVVKPQPGTVIQPTKARTAEDDVNDGLNAGKSWEQISRETNVDLDAVRKYSNATRPSYGTKMERPKQSFGNRIRDVFDTNTESDKFRRQEGNNKKKLRPGETEKGITLERQGNIVSKTPIVGHVAKTLNTLGAQIPQVGFTAQQQLATAEYSAATEEYRKAVKSGDKAWISRAKQRSANAAKRVKDIDVKLDAADENFQKNDGGLFNTGTLYGEDAAKQGDFKTGVTDIALPTAVAMLDLYTLGKGNVISEGIKQGGFKAGVRTQLPNIVKATAGNYASGDLSARSEGAGGWDPIKAGLLNSLFGIVPDVGLPSVGRALRGRLPKVSSIFSRNVDDVVRSADDAVSVAPSTNRLYGTLQKQIEDSYNAGDNSTVEKLIQQIPEADRAGIDPRPSVTMRPQVDPVTKKITMVPVENAKAPNVVAPPKPAPQKLLTATATPEQTLWRKILNRFSKEDIVGTSDNASLSASAEGANQGLRKRAIPVSKDIPIDEIIDEGLDVPVNVRNLPQPEGNIIREVTGDATEATTSNAIADRAAQLRREAAESANIGRPDPRISGISRPNTGNTGLFTRAEIDAERASVETALKQGEIDAATYKEVTEQLNSLKAIDDAPTGQKIDVKEVNSIPVTDQTVVPTGLPETPGTVRVSSATDPNAAKSAVVASQPPIVIPREVQEVLDNPKQFNKRQVAAARNQRKLAMQMAKTQEQTAEALSRIETASPAAQSGEGFTPTGEFAKSQNGGTYQKASRATEMAQAVEETANMSPDDVLKTARDNQTATGGFNRRDIRNIAALFEEKRIPRGSPEWQEARQILKEDGTVWGQQGALRNYTMRRNATTNELISRYESKIYRLADDPTKIESKWFDEVEAAEDAYVTARDDALSAYNDFTRDPTNANAKRYHAAQDVADKADVAAKQAEYSVANRALKGNKDIAQVRELDKMANEADMYQMDAVDASMLSGTGTFIRNFVNSAVGHVEEGLFGGVASRITRKLTGQNVGGGIGKGTISGFGDGVSNLRSVSGARAKVAGKNPLEHLKNWSTTGNQLGDTVIDSQVKHNVIDHYTGLLKEQGFTGRELRDRASVMARQDPDNLAREYAGAARVSAGLGNGVTRNNKVETLVKDVVSNAVSAGKPTALSEATGKLVARMTIGFPTAIGRSTVEGVKRFTVGVPTFIKAARETDPLKRSILIKEGIKQAGTGTAVIPPLFYALGASGAISGAYPTDDETRAQWEREGKTENSIKIGGAWYQLPAYLGAWAVPGLFYASLGRNGGNFSEATADTAKAIPSLLPTDQASNIMDVINGRTDLGKFMAQTGAATVRAATPAGALLNQIAKAFDPTKNDTNSGTNIENFVDKVLSGIPGVNNMAGIPDKVSDTGEPISNPNPLEIFAGAASDVQSSGEQASQAIEQQTNSNLQALFDRGYFDDPNLKEILDEKEALIYTKIKTGKKLKEGELNDLQKALVKGVSSTGDDTAYLEREQYDTNLRALQLKRELMNSDKTVKPSDLKKVDNAIKRGEVYRDNEIPYDLIEAYQGTGVEEWRKMGDPESDDYNPEMYELLFNIDDKLTQAGVSYKKGALDKPKYTAKDSGKGGGKGGKKQIDTSFGTLKEGNYAPRVQQYETLDSRSGSVPVIRTVRPNIVHNISSSR